MSELNNAKEISMETNDEFIPYWTRVNPVSKKPDTNGVQDIVLERGKNYGDPGPRFETCRDLMDRYEEFIKINHPDMSAPEMKRLRHVAYLIFDKLTRLAVTPTHRDSFVDIGGYADCGKMSL